MKRFDMGLFFLVAIWQQSVLGLFPPAPLMENIILDEYQMRRLASRSDPLSGNGTFEQPIDHENASLGNYQQRFWYNATFWKGPGSPIILMTPGESAADQFVGYITTEGMPGMYAEAVGGAAILIEHRYWGNSSPYDNLTTKNLQYLTLDQAVADFVNFAKKVKLPFDTSNTTNAPQAPWVFVGGSYSGALAAWIEKLSPGVFWAYHASSAPVQAIYDFWEYFYPIQMGMPQNCSHDYSAIVDHVDDIFMNGSPQDKQELKEMFSLQDLKHDDDAASAITGPVFEWQTISFTSNYSLFYQMCDAIEGVVPGKEKLYSVAGIGLQQALPNFVNWFKFMYLPGRCDGYGYSDWAGPMNVQCWDTYNTSMQVYQDISPKNIFNRNWVWMTCNEPFFYWQTGSPPGQPSLMSRLANAEYYERQCRNWFPPEEGESFASSRGKTEFQVNDVTGGWMNAQTTRLLYSNGEYDPWRSASVSSIFRPGGPLDGSTNVPVILINGSRHCDDWSKKNAINPAVAAAQQAEIAQISNWVSEFYSAKSTESSSATTTATASLLSTGRASSTHGGSNVHLTLLGWALAFVLSIYDRSNI